MFWMEYLGQGMDPLLLALTSVSWASRRYVLYPDYSVTRVFYLLWWMPYTIFMFHSMILFQEAMLFSTSCRQTLQSILNLHDLSVPAIV